MSTALPTRVRCPHCQTGQTVLLAESANAQRSPAWRAAVLEGSLHRFTCDACGLAFQVERDFLYSDLLAGILIGVFPRTRLGELQSLEQTLATAWAQTITGEAPEAIRATFVGPGPRVVFGLGALREKVV